jgi:hypothetical protein
MTPCPEPTAWKSALVTGILTVQMTHHFGPAASR